jgi:hypothetical protein
LQHVVDRLVRGQTSTLRDDGRQVTTLEQLHDEIREDRSAGRGRGPDVGDARDMLALQLCGRSRLAQEPPHGIGLRSALGEEELHRDRLLELDVHASDDRRHPAQSDEAVDAILARHDLSNHDR